jgi:hypothetical protein
MYRLNEHEWTADQVSFFYFFVGTLGNNIQPGKREFEDRDPIIGPSLSTHCSMHRGIECVLFTSFPCEFVIVRLTANLLLEKG